MPSAKDFTRSTSKEKPSVVEVATDELVSVHTDELYDVMRQTEALEVASGRRRKSRVSKQGTGGRQVVPLRKENRQLRRALEEQHGALQQLQQEYGHFQTEVDKEVAVIHSGYLMENEQNQKYLQALLEERNRIQTEYNRAQQQIQELCDAFQDAVASEAQRQVREAAQALESSTEVPPLLQEVVGALEMRARTVQSKYLVEAHFLKREIQALAQHLRSASQQLEDERQQLAALQYSVRQQAELRMKTLQSRVNARWKLASIATSVGLLTLLVVLQYVFLSLLHVATPVPVTLSILAPIMVCIALAVLFAQPLTVMKHLYESAPHKKKASG